MSSFDSHSDVRANWQQQEDALTRLHDAARTVETSRAFYSLLIDAFAACWGRQVRVAAWVNDGNGLLIAASPEPGRSDGPMAGAPPQVAAALATGQRHAGDDALQQPVANVVDAARPHAVIDLTFAADASPEMRDACGDFASVAADAASDFHAFSELRRLAIGDDVLRHSGPLVRSLQRESQLVSLAYAAANEGRRLLSCDRLTVLLRRGRRFRVLAVSGADHVESHTEFTRRAERLARRIADWGDPLAVGHSGGDDDIPPPLAESTAAYLDATLAKTLAAAPVSFPRACDNASESSPASGSRNRQADVVFVAEWFAEPGPADAAVRTTELAELCAGALERGAALDGPLIRSLVRRVQRRSATASWTVPRWFWATVAVAGAAAALALIPARLEVAAPATLLPVQRQDVFAPTTGQVIEVRVRHGDAVQAGAELAVIDDPQLQLQWEQVTGELETVIRRIDALAIARTERDVREQNGGAEGLPPGAEQQQLAQRRRSLIRQRDLLTRRREELTVRSPIDGVVLTRDVESLLASRPVERGQVLLTVADPASAWELVAEVEQRDIGRVVEARRDRKGDLPVRFRLPGDVDRVREGKLTAIEAAATLDVDDLAAPPPPVAVRIAVTNAQLDEQPRPGLQADVRVDCGKHSLGYVWFHDVAATVYRWWAF